LSTPSSFVRFFSRFHALILFLPPFLSNRLLQKEPKKRITWEGFFNHPWLTGAMVGAIPMPVFVATHGYPVAPVASPSQDGRLRQLEAEVKTLKEREENMKQFIQDQQRYMQEQNTRIEQYRTASEALQERVKKMTTALSEADDTIAAYKYAFTDSFSAP
jgi:septal ring factor EnvC (AmiA/AmiB activator)